MANFAQCLKEISTQEEEFVTIRKQKNNYACSMNNLNDINSSSLNESQYSVPDLSMRTEDIEIQKLKQRIMNLEEQLQSADQEIQNLLSENFQLKNTIQDLENKAGRYKNLYIDAVSETKTKFLKRHNVIAQNKKDLSSSYENLNVNNYHTFYSNTITHPSTTNTTLRDIELNDKEKTESEIVLQNSFQNKSDSITKKQDGEFTLKASMEKYKEIKKNRLYIIGEQHTSGLWKYITSNKEHKWHDRYNIVSFVKPNALSSEAYKTLTTIESSMSPGDRVVLSVGANDNNPYMLLNQIGRILDKLQHVKVYVAQVFYNRHLCINTINSNIAGLINIYKNCEFIKYERGHNRIKTFLTYIANRINYYLNYDDYYNTYLTFNKQILLRKSEKQYNKKVKKYIQNKITNYFNSVESDKNIYDTLKSGNNYHTVQKKGTIPYYFNIARIGHKIGSVNRDSQTITNQQFFRKQTCYSTPKHC